MDALRSKFNPDADVMNDLANSVDGLDNVQITSLQNTINSLENEIATNASKFDELLGELHRLLNPE